MKRQRKIRMRARPRVRRDQDYRGQKTTVDWSKLAYMVKRGRPGALEVLQDALETYFPKQFREAKEEAQRNTVRVEKTYVVRGSFSYRRRGGRQQNEYLVYFMPSVARHRFLPAKDARSHREVSPFAIYPAYMFRHDRPLAGVVAVYSGKKDNHRPRRQLLRRRLYRSDWWDREELIWYQDKNPRNLRRLVRRKER